MWVGPVLTAGCKYTLWDTATGANHEADAEAPTDAATAYPYNPDYPGYDVGTRAEFRDAEGKPLDPVWRDEVEKISHRHYSTGFFYGYPGQYTEHSRYIREWQICGIVESCDENGIATVSLNNKFREGDELEVVGPNLRPFPIIASGMTDLEGTPLDEPRTPQMKFRLPLGVQVPAMSIIRRSVELSAK